MYVPIYVSIWKDCQAKGHIIVDWLRVVLPWSILVQMIILNNLIDSIVLIKSIESLITMWFYPLNPPLWRSTLLFHIHSTWRHLQTTHCLDVYNIYKIIALLYINVNIAHIAKSLCCLIYCGWPSMRFFILTFLRFKCGEMKIVKNYIALVQFY